MSRISAVCPHRKTGPPPLTMSTERPWSVRTADPAIVERLALDLGVPALAAMVLVARDLADPARAAQFLAAGPGGIRPPHALSDLLPAADEILAALARKEPIGIIGDYDVDGLTAACLLYWVIGRKLDGECRVVIPHRNRDGYGMSVETIERLAASGVRLVVAVDNGTSAVAEVARALELGMRIVVVDHHTPPPVLPRATALVNPLKPGCDYPFKGLAAVGLAHKLCEVVLARSGHADAGTAAERFRETTLDLVAIGTISDLVPLVDENRALVRAGLAQLGRTSHPGLRALLDADGMGDAPVPADWVAFGLAPRLNAAGRVADPVLAFDFLVERSPRFAVALARDLSAINRKRSRLVEQLWAEVVPRLADQAGRRIPVVVLETPYRGLMGLVATRVREALRRPAVALAADGVRAVGSARSVEGFDIARAIESCSRHLQGHGGHHQAAGLSLVRSELDAFVDALQAAADPQGEDGGAVPALDIAAEVVPADLDTVLPRTLEGLSPFGAGNPAPVFVMRRVKIGRIERFGVGGRHVRLHGPAVPDGVEIVGLGLHAMVQETLERASSLDLAFTAESRVRRGARELVLRLVEVRSGRAEKK